MHWAGTATKRNWANVNVTKRVPWRLHHPPVGHCDTPTHTIRHCNDSPPCHAAALRPNFSYMIRLRIFRPGCFHGGLIVTAMISPAQASLLVTIRPAWRYGTTATCKVVRMRWPNLTQGMVDPTQEDTIDPCLGGVLLGGSSHIWVRLGQACAQLTQVWWRCAVF
jgi:hypothetical protein